MLSLSFNNCVIMCTMLGGNVNYFIRIAYYFIVLCNLSLASECP